VKVRDALRCSRQKERVRIPAHWVTAYHHGHRIRVRVPAQTRMVKVMRCHARVVYRRVRRHGHWVRRRIVLLPHRVSVKHLHVQFGRGATIFGWLGTTEGTALGGQPVRILAAPDNGSPHFRQIAVVRTASDGTWTARLPAGPSRLVKAAYGGGPKAEPSVSEPARLQVSAGIRLRIHPRFVHWGHAVRIRGFLRGGYVPPRGEIVVLWVRWKGGSAEVGHLYTHGTGHFSSIYTFRRGNGTETYQYWATSIREADYPYAPGRSNRVAVRVSP
jgi:hypothetical protein